MTKTFTWLVLVGLVLMRFILAPTQAQNKPEWFELTRGTGTLTGSNPDWILFPIDVTKFSRGSLKATVFVEPGTGISRTRGKCGGKAQFSEEGFFDPNYKEKAILPNQTALLLGNFSKPTKFNLAVISVCRPELSSKFEYVIYIRNEQKINADIPCDDQEVKVDYDKNSSDYHHYGPIETRICLTTDSRCSLDSVYSKMLSQVGFITPTENSSQVKNCMEVDVHILGSVKVFVDNPNYSVTNYTRKDHKLHPGKVTRKITEKNGAIYVVTEGEGLGVFQI